MQWGRGDVAMLFESWYKTRQSTTYLINPSRPDVAPKTVFERSSEDYYGNPGNFLQKPNEFNSYSLLFSKDGKKLYLTGEGYSPEGNKPFLDEFDLKTFKTNRLWQADGIKTYEAIVRVVDPSRKQLITSIQGKTVNPNYFMRTGDKLRPLTNFPILMPHLWASARSRFATKGPMVLTFRQRFICRMAMTRSAMVRCQR